MLRANITGSRPSDICSLASSYHAAEGIGHDLWVVFSWSRGLLSLGWKSLCRKGFTKVEDTGPFRTIFNSLPEATRRNSTYGTLKLFCFVKFSINTPFVSA